MPVLFGALVEPFAAAVHAVRRVRVATAGISRSLADAVNTTRFVGSVCLIGMGAPTLQLDEFPISTEERSLVGSFACSSRDFLDAAEWIDNAPAALGSLISREVSPEQANGAFVGLARPSAVDHARRPVVDGRRVHLSERVAITSKLG